MQTTCTCSRSLQVLFSIIIGSFNLGNALPEIQTIATAMGAATVVYEIIDRVRAGTKQYGMVNNNDLCV